MNLLRIYCSLSEQPQHCQWVLLKTGIKPVAGEGLLSDLPQRAERIQLVVPADQVLITRARVPQGARRSSGSLLAFAVEDKTAGEPDANQVSWLGSVGEEDVLAVIDKVGLERWQKALGEVGIHVDEVHGEMLLLPIQAGEWSIAWNGSDGFVRSGEFEGAATDSGDRESPPLFLRLMLEDAQKRNASPTALALYPTSAEAEPDISVWQRELGVKLHSAGTWDWRSAAADAGISLAQQKKRWLIFSGALVRLRPAAWILGTALALHAVALISDWTLLAAEQRTLRQQMETRFRTSFPDAVAVVDPVLQMRRKLAEAHHKAGLTDSGDFLPMIEQVAAATKGVPANALRAVSYEGGRITLELATSEETVVQRIVAGLEQAGLSVDISPATARTPGAKTVLTVRVL